MNLNILKYSKADTHFFITCRTSADQKLVSVIALAITSEKIFRIGVRVARFLQFPYGDRVGMLIHPDHLDTWEPFLATLAEGNSTGWDLLIWNEWTDTQGLLERTKQWAIDHGESIFSKETCRCPVVSTEGVTREEVAASLGKKRKTNLRRCRKKLAQVPHEIVHCMPQVDQVEELLKDIKKTELASWKGDKQSGLFGNPACCEFFKEISLSLAQSNQLTMSLIYINEELATYRYGFYFRDTVLDYSIAFLPKHRPLALGTLLLEDLINYAVDNRYKAVDASRVTAASKNLICEWSDQRVVHYRLYWFSGNLRGRLMKFLTIHVKPFAKSLRDRYRKWKA